MRATAKYFFIVIALWYARSTEIVHSSVMEALVWMRVPGDIVFSLGAVALGIYALKLLLPPKERALAGEAQPGTAD